MPTKRASLAIQSVHIARIAPPAAIAVVPARPRAQALLLTPTLPHRVLLNAHLVEQAQREGRGHVYALVTDVPLSLETLAFAEAGHLPSVLELLPALIACSAPLQAIANLLGCHKSEASRLIKLAGMPDLVEAVCCGELSLSHAKRLASRPPDTWADLLAEKPISVRRLEGKLAGREQPDPWTPDPDTRGFLDRTSGAIGSAIRLTRPSQDAWHLEIDWTSLAILQGILAHLGAGDARDHKGLPDKARVLRIELASSDEVTALLEHLDT